MADTLSLTALTLPPLPSHSAAFTCAHMDCSCSQAVVPVRACACARVLGFGLSHVRVRQRLRLRSKWLVGRLRHSSPSCSLCLPMWPMPHLLFEPALTRVSPFVPDPAHTHTPIHSTSPSLLASHSLVLAHRCSHPFAIIFGCLGLPVFIRAQSRRDRAQRSSFV